MYKELTVKTNSGDFRVFIQNGFFSFVSPSTQLHAHSFTELHFIVCDKSVMNIDHKNFTLHAGDMAIIPPGVYHRCVSDDLCTSHTAFQIDSDADKFEIHSIGKALTGEFFREIRNLEKSGDYSRFSAYVALFTSYFSGSKPLKAFDITNHKFLIREFFSQKYNEDIHLCDLANLLHVSERHAERLVIENMGHTFKDTLARTRISMAKNLIRTTDMSYNQIAAYVGYKSYSGFWKAMKKYDEMHASAE